MRTTTKHVAVAAAGALAAVPFLTGAAHAAGGLTITQSFTATNVGGPIGLSTTVRNAGSSASATVVIKVSSSVLPGYMYAKGTGFSCTPSEITRPKGAATFTCKGTVGSGATSVITVSSGSKIPSSAAGKAVSSTAKAGSASAKALATYR